MPRTEIISAREERKGQNVWLITLNHQQQKTCQASQCKNQAKSTPQQPKHGTEGFFARLSFVLSRQVWVVTSGISFGCGSKRGTHRPPKLTLLRVKPLMLEDNL